MADVDIQVESIRQPGWFWADNAILDEYGPQIGPYGLALYLALARHADKTRECWPSYETLAHETGMSRSQVMRTAKLLATVGLIAIERRRDPNSDTPNQTNVFRLLAVTVTVTLYTGMGGVPQTPPECTTDTPPVATVHPRSVPQTPKQDSINKTQLTRGGDAPARAAHTPPPPPPDTWDELTPARRRRAALAERGAHAVAPRPIHCPRLEECSPAFQAEIAALWQPLDWMSEAYILRAVGWYIDQHPRDLRTPAEWEGELRKVVRTEIDKRRPLPLAASNGRASPGTTAPRYMSLTDLTGGT